MKVVITHTDLRIYWPSRIAALQQALERRGDELWIVEIAGAGSHYAFAGKGSARSGQVRNWDCLYPADRMEDISAKRASNRLMEKLEELDPDIVMSGSFAYPSGATAVRWAKTYDKPVVIFDDIRPEHVPRNPFVNYIKRTIYRQVDAVLCPAPSWKDAFLHWGFRAEQLFFGVNAVDNAFWERHGLFDAPVASTPLVAPPPAGMTAWPSPFLLAVGRQIPAKNFLFLLRVYENYQRARIGQACLPLVIVGQGPERAMMENFVSDRGFGQVYFLPFADPGQLRAIYHHAAALVLPSVSETWGLVVNEAMAAGLPVLVSNACGCASVLVDEGVNGYTFPPDNPHELLETLLAFTNLNAGARAAMSAASRERIGPWGLDRFVKGSLQAIDHAMTNRKCCRSMSTRWILRHWKGRYRPV